MITPTSCAAPFREKTSRWLPLIGLILLLVSVYSTTFNYELSFDDPLFFGAEAREAMSSGLDRGFSTDYFGLIENPAAPTGTPYYRPLPLGVMVLERRLFGDSVQAFRMLHFALHLINVLLMIALVTRLLGREPSRIPPVRGATVAGALFAFSPFTVDAVLLLTALGDLMAFGLATATLICFLSWMEKGSPSSLILVTMLSAGAMLSKENAFALPLVLTILSFPWGNPASRNRAIAGVGAAAFSAGAVYAVRAQVIPASVLTAASLALPYIPGAIVLAIRSTFVPIPCPLELSVSRGVSAPLFWSGVLIISVAIPLAARFHKRAPTAFVGLGIWLAFLGPSLLALPSTEIFAPRYLYLPALGSSLVFASATQRVEKRGWRLGISAVLAVFAIFMMARTAVWKDGITLWTTELERNPDSLSAHINLGNELLEHGRLEEAFALELRAAELATVQHRPCIAATAEINAANILMDLGGGSHRALELFEKSATRCREKSFAAWTGIATIHARNHRFEKAERAARLALQGAPDSPDLQVFLGGLLLMQGRSDEAVHRFDTARRLTRDNPSALEDVNRRIAAARAQARNETDLQ